MKLYACSTYYHALIACVKQLVCRSEADALITGYIPDGAALARRIDNSGLFRRTVYIDGVQEHVSPNIVDYILFHHRKNAAAIERCLPPGFRFENYDEVDIFHDDTWMAHYMKDRRLPYRIVEDALDSCKTISSSCFSFMLPQKGIKPLLKRLFRIGYLFFGEDGLAYEFEVNDSSGVEIPPERLTEVPRRPLFDALTAEDKQLLLNVFGRPELPPVRGKTALVLTQPLYADGLMDAEKEQLTVYRDIVKALKERGYEVVLKPHPRDMADYSGMGVPVLARTIPAEMLRLAGASFDCAVAIASTALTEVPARERYRWQPGEMKMVEHMTDYTRPEGDQ